MEHEVIDFADARVRRGDHAVRGTAMGGMIRAFAVSSRETVQTARERHHTSSLVTAALGRLMMAAQMMGLMSKNDDELLTLSVRGSGPIGGLTVTANNHGQVKGFAHHPNAWLPVRADGHLDVRKGIGSGELSAVFDQPGVMPYSSEVPLVSGEIAEDVAYYFAASDQVPSAVGLGVLVGADTNVRNAGGFIVQLMPDCPDEFAEQLEQNLKGVDSVTDLLEAGMSPTDILKYILRDMEYEELDAVPVEFYCGCDEPRAKRAVAALGESVIRDMISKSETAEVICHFCGQRHYVAPDVLVELLEE
ncbi:MAG: Hsp33 family molecular chaperone HslO [Atopobiaceae bacterium]|nr:Hsp33 family molecular chaperone HslO [Atopobiaceae bacterium]